MIEFSSQATQAMSIVSYPILIAVTLAFILPCLLVLICLILARIFTTRDYSKEKFDRYEAGNPPFGRARGLFPMQYYPYLIIFLTVEPVLIYLFLVMMALHESTIAVGLLFSGISALLAFPLLFGLDSAGRLKLWSMRED